MSEAIIDVVTRILVEVRRIDPELVKPESSLIDDLGADSLDAVEIIMALEDHYGKELDNLELEKLKTVGDIVQLIQSAIE